MNFNPPTSPEIGLPQDRHHVGECLYRNASSGNYYAFLKSRGKQFRLSLKTRDYTMAKRRLAEMRARLGRTTSTLNRGIGILDRPTPK